MGTKIGKRRPKELGVKSQHACEEFDKQAITNIESSLSIPLLSLKTLTTLCQTVCLFAGNFGYL